MINERARKISRIYGQVLRTPNYILNTITIPYIIARGILEVICGEEIETNRISGKDYSFE